MLWIRHNQSESDDEKAGGSPPLQNYRGKMQPVGLGTIQIGAVGVERRKCVLQIPPPTICTAIAGLIPVTK